MWPILANNRNALHGNGNRFSSLISHLSFLILMFFLSACRNDMYDQPYMRPYERTTLYPNQTSARQPVAQTMARGELHPGEEAFRTGKTGGQLVQRMPVPATAERIQRGRERYAIYCTPCHGVAGDGNGMIIQRGFGPPPSYHINRLRAAPDGHLFDVITNGYGTMYSYASRVETADRWAVVAYLRALQLSRHARVQDLPVAERDAFTTGTAERE